MAKAKAKKAEELVEAVLEQHGVAGLIDLQRTVAGIQAVRAAGGEVVVRESAPGGRPTAESVILACACQSTAFVEERRTRRAVVFTCAKCGAHTSVQGSVALARVAQDELSFAVLQKSIAPDPEAASGAKKPSPAEEGFEYFRAKMTREQGVLLRRACDAVRVMNCDKDWARSQMWQGTAVECIVADFLAGCDPAVLRVVDAQEEAVQEAAALAMEKGRNLTRKRTSMIRTAVRDSMAAKLGITAGQVAMDFETTFGDAAAVNEMRAMEQAAKEAERAADDRVLDDGSLRDALDSVRRALGDQAKGEFLIAGPAEVQRLVQIHARQGGYLFRVEGDPRTCTKSGVAPTALVWWLDDYSELVDLPLAYEEQFEGDESISGVQATVTELLPVTFGDGETGAWEMPAFATKRETLR
jgi:hypothetical protein